MKIKENDGTIIDVYAVYWIDSKTFFCGLVPYDNYGGILVYSPDEVTVIDPIMRFHTIFYKGESARDEYGIYHWALLEKKLLPDLFEADGAAYKTFIEIIKSEGLVSEDFY